MNPGRQALLGIFMAVLSGALVLGSFSLSIAEKGLPLALVETGAPTSTWTSAPITYAPGQPTFTNTPTPAPTDTATPYPTPSHCPPPAGWDHLKVESWHTLDWLADEYKISPEELAEANCLVGNTLPAGSNIYVPPRPKSTPMRPSPTACKPSPYAGWVRYQVRPGETFTSIAGRVGSTAATLMRVNCIFNPKNLIAWEYIWVPYIPPTYTSPPKPTNTPTATAPAVNTPTSLPPETQIPTATWAPTLTPSSSAQPTGTPHIETPTPTDTQGPTDTPMPTDTSAPTNTPLPTNTPIPPYPYPDPGESVLSVYGLIPSGGLTE